MARVHFTDYFDVDRKALAAYGAFNVSLLTDLPLFIDPFLLFNSKRPRYRVLHDSIIEYLRFLRDRSGEGRIDPGLLTAWFMFSEVRQTWLGYTEVGNRGSGLGRGFADAMSRSLQEVFRDFGNEKVTRGSHLEKLCLIQSGVGRDNISDFTTNLIKGFLLEYTQEFARTNIPEKLRRTVNVPRTIFNYHTQAWETRSFDLPWFSGDYVLLTPRDILTRDETWLNRPDMIDNFETIAEAVPNEQLRSQVNRYFQKQLSKRPTRREEREAADRTISKFPAIIEHYIRYKEDRGDRAAAVSSERVSDTESLFVRNVAALVRLLEESTDFYGTRGDTLAEARARVGFLKDVIENQDGWKLLYLKKKPLPRERDLHILYRLTWYGTPSDVTREANDGRGPVDFKVSRGAKDKSLVEFKLASNSQLMRNLRNQTKVYEGASGTSHSLRVILYFNKAELVRVKGILKELKLESHPDIILIDARSDNKPSGSKA